MEGQEYIFNTELGQKLLVLTRAGFAISNQINDLIMRDKIKGKVLDIYEAYGGGKRAGEILREIETLDNLLYLSGHLGVAKEEHIKKLRNGYLVLKSHVVLTQQARPVFDLPPLRSSESNNIESKTFGPDAPASKKDLPKRSDMIALPIRAKISERHNKVLDFIKNNDGKAQLSQLISLFPKLSEKSIRNDLAQLCADGKLKRIGWGQTSFYQLTN
ncbi:hypothetical protein A2833_03350 [Candidatus Azambacteria bacterium RIFCSPHIGHO2_01_FULL_44_55]|uniref:HTH deoR-type domain-containing protein n=1 Tax=Candidatus Azambacteria bacterium RIFCSPLOWO2_02_FULL_44_14 TaxID=1797306 RepID=A0A1F5CCD6_9BACT|nr:MAG: hypothetical protein A3C78_00855 [Candidatus Azambacteria bacterium RIFCSPHIGHO2_02_FULL_45_18]OGD40507.1 MAG: hypothetical protein A3I30_00885 [Candidatus Azambacteria bacterium RIFCSPLOWO2_02_FULL_44_14]OGD41577.1 MAG: hypothetical protein A2833_03350 [Candidatus Azambacteria bacterium RIFCSPHIGHO2_01_FULL_44_55]OGD52246.1 MAG: hypothetical protein A2608_02715 [Candidatus Azambacteria bacterium RIFOXYD1_FULL_44_10]